MTHLRRALDGTNRIFVYLRAKLTGSWWVDCPVCGEGFAAFEASCGDGVNHDSDSYQLVCAKDACRAEARRQTSEVYRKMRDF